MQQTTTELIKFGLEWGNPQNINHTWNLTFFGFLSAAQPSRLTIQKIWLFLQHAATVHSFCQTSLAFD